MSEPIIEGEEWKAIPGFEGFYSASNKGRIRRADGFILKPCPYPPSGYLHVNLWKDGVATTVDVHRLVLAAFRGYDPEKPHGNHLDCNTANNDLENLEWCTPAENIEHSFSMMRRARARPKEKRAPNWCKGERHHSHKLTEADVRLVFDLRSQGWSQQTIADRVGIAQPNVSAILHGKKWKHITHNHC